MSPTGHSAMGLVAKKFAPELPLPILLLAANGIDLIYGAFAALGIERFGYDPYSHSLVMAIAWALLIGVIVQSFYSRRSAFIVVLVFLSHWFLDIIVWDNIPLTLSNNLQIGLGLYNRIGFSLTNIQMNWGSAIATGLELGMLAFGLWTWLKSRTIHR